MFRCFGAGTARPTVMKVPDSFRPRMRRSKHVICSRVRAMGTNFQFTGIGTIIATNAQDYAQVTGEN